MISAGVATTTCPTCDRQFSVTVFGRTRTHAAGIEILLDSGQSVVDMHVRNCSRRAASTPGATP